MTVTPTQLVATATLLNRVAERLPDVRAHVHRQLSTVDGYSSRGDGVGGRGTAELTTTERAAERRLEIERWMADADAGLHLIIVTIADVFHALDKIGGMRVPVEHRKCSQHVDPLCENLASEHRHPDTGIVHDDVCDACWLSACPVCRSRAPEERRGGRCEACYRRALRNAQRGAA